MVVRPGHAAHRWATQRDRGRALDALDALDWTVVGYGTQEVVRELGVHVHPAAVCA
ncbi:MAG: hypothetical protein ACRDWI_09900 [Jiangellaceae bacterium]